jgi:hypothetical protein
MTIKQMYIRGDDKAEMIEIASSEYVAVRPALALGLVSRVEVEAARNSMTSDKESVSLSSYLKERAQSGEKV